MNQLVPIQNSLLANIQDAVPPPPGGLTSPQDRETSPSEKRSKEEKADEKPAAAAEDAPAAAAMSQLQRDIQQQLEEEQKRTEGVQLGQTKGSFLFKFTYRYFQFLRIGGKILQDGQAEGIGAAVAEGA